MANKRRGSHKILNPFSRKARLSRKIDSIEDRLVCTEKTIDWILDHDSKDSYRDALKIAIKTMSMARETLDKAQEYISNT